MPKYLKAITGPKNSVIYTDSDGKKWIFEGGIFDFDEFTHGATSGAVLLCAIVDSASRTVFSDSAS